jgi:hypothetical protein
MGMASPLTNSQSGHVRKKINSSDDQIEICECAAAAAYNFISTGTEPMFSWMTLGYTTER